ncbi:(2Fe-2S)-binding protein [Radiobacillus kanasensis]|uniref:(2Fe-2S)-binding protein n=1 Tax=Radiobacillus kanasensis TaxID=2844358 RepID=UPI001E58350D|nr:(2Fe-2S)-binding protein [Radiobacillus kanasensis]UFT98825.1 (2Fe-2S)-binding protein [Radiobacillus kanasensis]
MENNKLIICRCEEVSYEDIYNTAENYSCSSREIKLRTRAGMGYCGGRTCRHLIEKIVSDLKREKVPDTLSLSFRPPVRPIPFNTFKED